MKVHDAQKRLPGTTWFLVHREMSRKRGIDQIRWVPQPQRRSAQDRH